MTFFCVWGVSGVIVRVPGTVLVSLAACWGHLPGPGSHVLRVGGRQKQSKTMDCCSISDFGQFYDQVQVVMFLVAICESCWGCLFACVGVSGVFVQVSEVIF